MKPALRPISLRTAASTSIAARDDFPSVAGRKALAGPSALAGRVPAARRPQASLLRELPSLALDQSQAACLKEY
jgi:hypothetical protein